MSHLPRVAAAPTAEWADLIAEFDRWGEAGRIAVLWWRDDDAVAPTRQFDNLLRLAGETPVALAVIPALALPELAAALADAPHVTVLQHGWRHANRAAAGKKSEYPTGLSCSLASAEVATGRARLNALFGASALAIFVPPWNRIADDFLPLLPLLGIAGLSAIASYQPRTMPPDLRSLDVHLDLVAWTKDRGFIGDAAALGGLVALLQHRRRVAAPHDEQIGILTHHLVMDDATRAFLARLLALTTAHDAVRWAGVGDFL